MHEYKILKDFPSRNGAKNYKAGKTVTLDWNSRTKALVEMGFIKCLPSRQIRIAQAVEQTARGAGYDLVRIINTKNGQRRVIAQDANGKILFDGLLVKTMQG